MRTLRLFDPVLTLVRLLAPNKRKPHYLQSPFHCSWFSRFKRALYDRLLSSQAGGIGFRQTLNSCYLYIQNSNVPRSFVQIPMTFFPVEIVGLFVEHLSDSDFPDGRKALQACMVVSRDFLLCAR
ncbi:hypothetical protein CPB83DRAFT_331888 [Crepidotus variabilis]|uniref:Uncharacterized protein n=1 Tax=Crepidotus variabilis TaxID=179855 RepID=A0A9P6ES11_9AGAR|nr:hypothetical protein CPB83DRAFT_331888 [Crepidotus variabilis]